ncbi:MAG: chemotaxis protein CheW [Bdellovibrionota bacterium]
MADFLENMNKINSNMHSQISEQRKQDVHSFVKRFPRAVRELSRQLDKPATLNIIGEDIRVDPKIAAVLGKCLIHLIRNSMDHGIESKEKRQANGKMLEGKIDLSFLEEGENTIITISDDGGGIDVEKIKAKIIDKGLYTEDQLNKMSKSKILSQIFEPGFSTAEKVTDVSGRGVGMDMVKSSIESVNGRIELDSELGNGTVIKLVVPVPKSVTIIQALLVTAGTHTYSIPQESVFRLLSFSKEEERRYFRDYEGGRVLFVNNRLLPIIDLEKFLDIKVNVEDEPNDDSDDNINFVILNSKDGYFALKVDKILDAEDVVVKQLIRGIMNIGPYKGATFLADGSVGLILDCDKIIEMSRFIFPEDIRQETEGELVDSLANEDELLIFKIKGISQPWAIRLSEIFRLEEINISEYQSVGGNKVINYRDIISPVIDLQSTLQGISDEEISKYEILEKNLTLVIERQKRFYFLIIDSVQDVKMQTSEIKVELRDSDFIEGTTIVGDDIIAIIDVTNILSVSPFFDPQEEIKEELDNVIEINKDVDEPEEKLKRIEVGEYEASDVDLANGFGFF